MEFRSITRLKNFHFEIFNFYRKLDDSAWLTKEQLQDKIIERISDKMYEDFLIMMNRLIAHPYSYHAKDFIMSYRKTLFVQHKGREVIQPKVGPDGRNYVTTFRNF